MKTYLAFLCLFLGAVFASSHSEAPGTAKAPQSDITDFYMFRCYEPGREGFTCFIANAQPLQNPFAGPNYFSLSDDHFYEIYIDNNGDAIEDITFQFFLGNRLGGDLVDVLFEGDEDDCIVVNTPRNPRSIIPTPVFSKKHGGISLPVGGQMVPIALKFAGQITFENQGALNWFEWYRINIVRGDRTFGARSPITNAANGAIEFDKPFDYAGEKTFPNYEAYARNFIYEIDIPGCAGSGRVFVGQRAESFAIPLGRVFDLVNLVPVPGFPNAIQESEENNALRDLNISAFVLEVPTSCLVAPGQNGIIGAWTGVRELRHDGDEHVPGKQVSRLGNPLVNELLIGLKDKGRFNRIKPTEDIGFVDFYINYPSFPEILNILFRDAVNRQLNVNLQTIAPTNFPRNDLYAIFMTGIATINRPPNVVPAEMMRLNTSIPPTARANQNRFGVIGGDAAGYPNGRRPGDDVVDISLRATMGALCSLNLFCTPSDAAVGGVPFTDGAPQNAQQFDNTFPYLRTPTPGSKL